jgi:SAM-dependent methyltransferase
MTDYAKKEIWDKFWSRPYKKYEGHHEVFWGKIRSLSRGKVADLGCGSASCWRSTSPHLYTELLGFDFSETAIKEAKKNCPSGKFFDKDITDTGWESHYFDTVVLSGIVNYYKPLTKIMTEADRLCKRPGLILVTINVINDFPGRVWIPARIKQEFSQYGKVSAEFIPKIGWLVAIIRM